MLDWISPVLGLLLLLLLAVDVFRTAFHAKGRGGPLNRIQNRTLWRLVRGLGTRNRVRPAVLSLAGPLMAVTTIFVWSLLLLVGFWLIYLPHVLAFHFSPGTAGPALLESFYYSGIIASTLGQGDVVARGGWLRVLTVVQALAGFASVTVAVTYVLAVYREVVGAQSLAAAIAVYLEYRDGDATASGGGRLDAGDWERSLALRLGRALEAHFNYPILHYFRPARCRRSLPCQLARLHAAGADGGALGVMSARYAEEVRALFVPGAAEDADGKAGHGSRLDAILRMLAYDSPLGSP